MKTKTLFSLLKEGSKPVSGTCIPIGMNFSPTSFSFPTQKVSFRTDKLQLGEYEVLTINFHSSKRGRVIKNKMTGFIMKNGKSAIKVEVSFKGTARRGRFKATIAKKDDILL